MASSLSLPIIRTTGAAAAIAEKQKKAGALSFPRIHKDPEMLLKNFSNSTEGLKQLSSVLQKTYSENIRRPSTRVALAVNGMPRFVLLLCGCNAKELFMMADRGSASGTIADADTKRLAEGEAIEKDTRVFSTVSRYSPVFARSEYIALFQIHSDYLQKGAKEGDWLCRGSTPVTVIAWKEIPKERVDATGATTSRNSGDNDRIKRMQAAIAAANKRHQSAVTSPRSAR